MKELGVPNDLALSKAGFLFLSGQNWGAAKGALWLCAPLAGGRAKATLLEGGMGRTNGIALSPDDRTLYLTEALGSQAWKQRIWKYTVAADGSISNKTEFYNFKRGASKDSDGMRTD